MAWGLNSDGQLGNGTTTNEKEPVEVKGITEAVAIAAGSDHSLAVLKNGKVMAWGDNSDGQLGNNTTTNEKEPVEVKKITEATGVAGGEFHSLALLTSGKVMAWGENNDGQLGNGTTTNEKEPVEVKGITEAAGIAAGHNHSLAVLKNGKAMAWGDNNDGQLGNNTTTNEKEPVEVKKITEATSVAGGEFHSFALLTSGKVMAWGENNDGQLGNGTTTTEKEPVEVKGLSGAVGGISAGANFSLASYATKPSNTALPTISGEAKDEKALTATTGTWTGTPTITYSYQWESCNTSGESCSNISGATTSSYTITHEQVGHTIRVKVTAKNSAGEATATSSATATVAAAAPVNTALPMISGEAKDEKTLTASTGTWTGSPTITYSYQWESCNTSGESCTNISGATSSSYVIVHEQVGHTIRVKVTAKNSASEATATSAATATVAAAPPVNTALPAVSGTTKEGETLSASTGSWAGTEPFSYTYQWRSCNSSGESCSNISGATSSTYKLTSISVGKTLRIVVTAKNSVSSTEATSPASTVVLAPPSNTTLPAISGTVKDGQTLTASYGAWSGTTPIAYTYQWQNCNPQGAECHDVEGSTNSDYTVSTADIGTTLRVTVTASNAAGSAEATSAASAEAESGAPSELEAPSISGDPNTGATLYADAGTWGGSETETGYQWEHCNAMGGECASIAGATGSEYELGEDDIGITLRLRVGVSNTLGSVTAVSPATEVIGDVATLMNTLVPSISGIPQSGQTLTADAGSWLGVATIGYAYQWQSCDLYGFACEDIEGATESSYVPEATDVGKTLRVRVIASETSGTVTQTSAATQPIAATAAPIVEAPPAASGTGLIGDTLTATTGAWSGEEAVSYGYQWERCNEYGDSCSSISGATTNTYTLTESDATHTVRVLVTATDAGSGSTKAASFPVTVSAATLVNVAAPSISGTFAAERALNADRGIWTGAGALSYSYQWERCDEHGESCGPITGATESSYTPGEADIGDTLKVDVTATGTAGTESATSPASAMIFSEPIAPEDLFAPSIEGNLTSGETLTAQTGTWVSSETVTYAYQWQKCNEEGEECENISGATSSTYKLIEADLESTLRVTVTGKNTLGTASAESEPTAVVGTVGPPKNTSMPTINGTAKKGENLVAGNGTWSGSQPLSYFYRWERCNSSGESCTSIEGATKPGYTVASGDVGSTLRVKVTASNTLGSAGAVSAQTSVVAGSEASATSAIELTEKTDPSVLQPATTATLEEQEVKPAISDSGESLSGTTALTTSSVSKETPGEFAVNTPDGELSFQPVNSMPNATKTPTIVNGTAAVFAGTSNATDTIVRPDALGATTLLQLRSSEAPTSFSWEVGLGPNQHLEKLSDGDIAVVEVPATSPLEGSLGEPLESLESSEATAEHEGSGESGEAAEGALEEGVSGEGALEKLSAAPTTSTPAVEPKSGELHPQETKALYESATSTVASAEEHVTGTTLMVIEPPKVIDAKGNTVSSSLSIEGDTFTMRISTGGGTMFPATADLNIAALSDVASAAKASKVRYGLSDPNATSFEDSEEEAGRSEAHFDKHLKEGQLHVGIARDVIPYTTHPNNGKLIAWLKAVKKAGLQPYIALSVEPRQFCKLKIHASPCVEPGIVSYEKHVKELIVGLMAFHAKEPSAIPPVTLWGAWNEPDFETKEEANPLYKNPKRSALFWKKARSIMEQVGCSCTMVAGEFAEDDGYIAKYAATIQHNRSFGLKYPHVWGFHDYHDLVNYYHHPQNSYAEAFIRDLGRRLHNPRIWFSEQGVALRNGEGKTNLDNGSESEDIKRQREAAKDFLKLGSAHLAKERSRVEVVDYYLYKGPSGAELTTKPNAFDSGMLPGPSVEEEKHPAENPRQAYCVLALGREGCPAESKTMSAVASSITSVGSTISLAVNPYGLTTHYLVEYGTTGAYGKTTTATVLANQNGIQSETIGLKGLEPCTTYHYQAEAENAANEGVPGFGGDKTFSTKCAIAISAGGYHACALFSEGSIDCWGANEHGELGDGTTESSSTPVPVEGIKNATALASGGFFHTCALISGGTVKCWGDIWLGGGGEERHSVPVTVPDITNATAVAAGNNITCALLSGGSVECWGYNEDGLLGNGIPENNTEPIKVSGITNAIAIGDGGGGYSMCALLATGGVDCWGTNEDGQLGDGTEENSGTPVAVGGISDATAISTGEGVTCALLSGGGVDCWGLNIGGALGDGTYTGPSTCVEGYAYACSRTPVAVSGISNATAISSGDGFVCAILSGSSVDCWGPNEDGELGDGTFTGPGKCIEEIPCSDTPVSVDGISGASAVAAGNAAVCALLSGGDIDCWGEGEAGQLGNGTTENSSTPVSVRGFG